MSTTLHLSIHSRKPSLHCFRRSDTEMWPDNAGLRENMVFYFHQELSYYCKEF